MHKFHACISPTNAVFSVLFELRGDDILGRKKKRKDIFSLSSFFWDSFSSSLTIRSGSAVPSQRSYIPRASPLCSGYFYGSISDSWNGIRRRLEPWDSYIYTYVRTLTRNTLAWQNCNRGHHLEPIQRMDQFRLVGVAMCAAPDGWCSFQRFVESVLDIVYRARRISIRPIGSLRLLEIFEAWGYSDPEDQI